MLIAATDPRLSFVAPQPPIPGSAGAVRLERFTREAYTAVAGQIGPLANLRSSTGCAIRLATDSPWIGLRLERLRHHQLVPVGVALEVETDAGVVTVDSGDLRERDSAVVVRFPTGLERGGETRAAALWLPLISTCEFAGLELADGARVELAPAPPLRWLAIGDSLTQGFTVQSPLKNWVHRLSRRWAMPVRNLGVGGIGIEPRVFAHALGERRWELVTIALGSNHSWKESDATVAGERAAAMAELALSGGHGRVAWMLPPWKPCEDGKGPPDFAGVILDRETGARAGRVREDIRAALTRFAPRLEIIGDLMPHDHRYLPDGLHPFAIGFARFADAVDAALHPGAPTV